MNLKSYVLRTLLVAILLSANILTAGADDIPTGKEKADFDLSHYKHFIDFDLSRPKPASSMSQSGIHGREIEGQLVDHEGHPIADVVVAVVEPIGYSSHCYYDNFDTTDAQGRFVVAGSVAKNRLVFRKPSGTLWKVNLQPEANPRRVTWPVPAKVTLKVPAEMAAKERSVTIQTHQYWAGMAVMRQTAEINDEGVAVFDEVVPGDYYATIKKTIEVTGNKHESRSTEIANFTIAAGESDLVQCGQSGATVIEGSYVMQPNALLGKLALFVLIERDKLSYVESPPVADLLNLGDEGAFQSRPLSLGHYTVKVMAKGLAAPGRFGAAGDRVLKSWRVAVDGSADTIDLDSIPEPDDLDIEIESVLQAAARATNRSRIEGYAERLKKRDDRSRAELRLLQRLTDTKYPYPSRRVIPGLLEWMTDSPRVVAGLLAALNKPIDSREKNSVMGAFRASTQSVNKIVAAVAPYLDDPNHITRGATIRVLGDLAVKHPKQAGEIGKRLERGLADPWESNRSTAADYLGRMELKTALPALRDARDDVDGPVAVQAAYSAWKISGDPDDVYPTITQVLSREGIGGMWQAALFTTDVAAEHPVPVETQQVLKRVAKMAGKPPFRSSYEYERSRAGKLAQQALDKIAAASL